jgi:predicted metal-dependent hydrolase
LEKGFIVRAPKRTSLSQIEKFLYQKKTWILNKLNYLESITPTNSKRSFSNGQKLLLLGKEIQIMEIPSPGKRIQLDYSNGTFNIRLPQNFDSNLHRKKLKNHFIKFYKQYALDIIRNRVGEFSSRMGISPSDVKIRTYKSRWGACKDDGTLIFNWKLIQAPIEIVDYVIVHELSHLKYMNHSAQYWEIVSGICPDYKKYQKWLKNNILRLRFE